MDYIQANLTDIREKIAIAARKSGREPADITLVGVTKTIGVDQIGAMVACGVADLGENKVQEILQKQTAPGLENVKWHMIGHLQTNKARQIVDKVTMIHSVDSEKLADEISKRALLNGRVTDILIEINIAGEESKFGVQPAAAERFVATLCRFDGIRVRGLMCVAPFVETAERNRTHFRTMRQLFIDINSKMHNNISMDHLSMGMTNDYAVAIEEGATIVRIGTGIFGERHY